MNEILCELNELKQNFETWQNVAKELGIKDRHLRNLRRGLKPGKTLRILIKNILKNINHTETQG